MNTVIQSFDNLHDNRILRYCADFECHTLHTVTLSETGESISVRFTGLLAHWFENVIQDNILFGMDEITADGLFERYQELLSHSLQYGFPAAVPKNCGSEWHEKRFGCLSLALPLDCADSCWLRR